MAKDERRLEKEPKQAQACPSAGKEPRPDASTEELRRQRIEKAKERQKEERAKRARQRQGAAGPTGDTRTEDLNAGSAGQADGFAVEEDGLIWGRVLEWLRRPVGATEETDAPMVGEKPAIISLLRQRWVVLAAALVLLLVVVFTVVLLGGSGETPDPAPSILSVTSTPAKASSPPPSSPPASSVAEPASTEPEPQPESAPEPIQLAWTEEELQRLNSLLEEWALVPTEIVTSEEDAEEVTVDRSGGHTVAVYFKDMGSGLEYIYNGESRFAIASLNKAPYAMYLYTLAEQGALSLEDTIHVTQAMLEKSRENSGILKDDENLPRDMTVEELILYLLRYSDTGVLRILVNQYGADGYKEYIAAMGIQDTGVMSNVLGGSINAAEAGRYLGALYHYMETGVYGAQLKEHLMNTRNLMIRSEWPVARKYGWDENAFHDMAVVYAAHPYYLAVLTDKWGGSWTEYSMFTTIAQTLEEMMAAKYAALEPAAG